MADGQIVRFKIREAFPADEQLARWMTVCAMALNDLLVVNQLLIPRLKEEIDSGQGEIFYLGRVASAHLFEAATFLRRSDRIPEISEFAEGLDDRAEAVYRELLEIGEGGHGRFPEQLKYARNKSFHYQELFLGDHEDREPLKQALEAHAGEERETGIAGGEIQDIPPTLTGFRATFAYDVASEMFLPGGAEGDYPEFVGAVSAHIAKYAQFVKAALNAYTQTKPQEIWAVEHVSDDAA
jgi:hypothetical protein